MTRRESILIRTLLSLPIGVALGCALGWALCTAARLDIQTREMCIASGCCLAGGLAATAVLAAVRRQPLIVVVQTGLSATVVHLIGCAALAAFFLFAGKTGSSFAYWIVGQYFLTLAIVVSGVIGMIHAPQPTA